MRLHLFKSKIHRATVTHADLDYEGSITLSGELMDAANIVEHEQVHVWNVTRGTRLVTYALRGKVGRERSSTPESPPDSREGGARECSGVVCINGAAAHLTKPGDLVIVATFAEVEADEARGWKPTVVLVDGENRIVDASLREIAGPKRRAAS